MGVSFDQPITTEYITGLVTLHMLDSICTVSPRIRFHWASTLESFELVKHFLEIVD